MYFFSAVYSTYHTHFTVVDMIFVFDCNWTCLWSQLIQFGKTNVDCHAVCVLWLGPKAKMHFTGSSCSDDSSTRYKCVLCGGNTKYDPDTHTHSSHPNTVFWLRLKKLSGVCEHRWFTTTLNLPAAHLPRKTLWRSSYFSENPRVLKHETSKIITKHT